MKEIENYDGAYCITEDGRVWSNKTKKFLRPALNKNGYLTIAFYHNGKHKTHYIHRLVIDAYRPKDPELTDTNHVNGIKTDNRLENLVRCTRSTNMKHAVVMGLHKVKRRQGEDHNRSKLTEADVRFIRRLKKDFPELTNAEIAKRYGVTKDNIWRIIKRVTWKNI